MTTPATTEKPAPVYQLKNGTSYHKETPARVVAVLERLRKSGKPCRLHLGDTATGRSWLEENDVAGTVGRSCGEIKIPLLIEPGECGGGGILDHCIIAIESEGKTIYKADNFQTPDLALIETPEDDEHRKEYPWTVTHGGEIHARFKRQKEAALYLADMIPA